MRTLGIEQKLQTRTDEEKIQKNYYLSYLCTIAYICICMYASLNIINKSAYNGETFNKRRKALS